jgi:hypothetical protein
MPKAWKRAELRVAKLFGTTRTGPTGRDDNDIKHALLAVEVKRRKALPKWALDCLEQARTGRNAAGKTPVVIMFGERMRTRDALLFMTVGSFEELWGPLHEKQDESGPDGAREKDPVGDERELP